MSVQPVNNQMSTGAKVAIGLGAAAAVGATALAYVKGKASLDSFIKENPNEKLSLFKKMTKIFGKGFIEIAKEAHKNVLKPAFDYITGIPAKVKNLFRIEISNVDKTVEKVQETAKEAVEKAAQ